MINIREKLEQSRVDLIDQGLRNPLINFRVLRSKGIEVVDEHSNDIFRLLVVNGKSMDFLSDPAKDQLLESIVIHAKESLKSEFVNPLYKTVLPYILMQYVFRDANEEDAELLGQPDEPDNEDISHFTDLHLQTPYSSKELQKRLLETSDAARVYIEEQGVNLLYLSLGELTWFEDDNSQIPHRAPLVLIPVELLRKSVDARFTIKYTEGGLGGNIALREKMNSDFRIQLPTPLEENMDEQELDVEAYFAKVGEAVRFNKRWAVNPDAINVSFFSFGKFLMYHDLDNDVWPVDQRPINHFILNQLLGDGFAQSLRTGLGDVSREVIDTYLSINNNYHVMDADSSQAQAIMAVKQGTTLAIQGPPGTGKSQTIANIIAELVGSGKTVLFVAEKLAALEVVKRRLDSVGVGDLCLELHSHKANKKILLEELRRTFRLGQPEDAHYEDRLNNLSEIMGELNRYSEAVNTPINKTGITPFYAYGALLHLVATLENLTLPHWSDVQVANWTKEEYQSRLVLIEDLQRRMQQDGLPKDNIFWGSNLKTIVPSTRDLLRRYSQTSLNKLKDIIKSSSELASLLSLDEPHNLTSALELRQIASAIIELPTDESINLASEEWLRSATKIEKYLKLGVSFNEQSSRFSHIVKETVWTSNLTSIKETIQKHGRNLLRGLTPSYRQAINEFKQISSREIPDKWEKQTELLDELIKIQKLYKSLEENASVGKRLFGDLWDGMNSNWDKLATISQSIFTLQKAILEKRISESILTGEHSRFEVDKIQQLINLLVAANNEFESEKEKLFQLVEFEDSIKFGDKGYKQISFDNLLNMLDIWINQTDSIQAMALFNTFEEKLSAFGLNEYYKNVAQWSEAPLQLVNLFNRNWFEQIINSAIHERKPLQMFDSLTHENRLYKFQQMDKLLLERNQQTIVLQHYENLAKTSSAAGQVRILREEFEKKRRHKPIRKLVSETFNAIQSVKPIFMMSPMSVATFLEPGTIQFDVVVFDEASQIRPADAFGSILRGKQVVVVGDSKQLPPTSFFDTISDSDSDNDDTKTSDYESILGLFNSRGVKDHMLRWHYRSQHESLIAVSNFEFYENRLLIVPSPQHQSAELGLRFRYQPNTYYEPGTKRYNRLEARSVAEAVIKHARENPDLTLGVAAFSQTQMQAIRDELEILRRQNTDCETFFNSYPNEPFFIKNLENVQGDERDIILISIGYGKTQDGKLSMNFGPLNKDGGERRLNVLITRARYRCEVFTNLLGDDIDLTKSQSRGIASLKHFLKYAETGNLEFTEQTLREPGSPFEEAVADKLKMRGYTIHYQVGTAGFFIDLAVVDPEYPGSYLIGIECDGAQYHSSASARDRDRLRQAILESKGWTIHRIWSTDWFNNPTPVLERTIQAIENAKVTHRAGVQIAVPVAEPKINRRVEVPTMSIQNDVASLKIEPYKLIDDNFGKGWTNIEDIPRQHLQAIIQKVIDVEGPIHLDEIVRRTTKALGFGRAGAKIRETIEEQLRLINTVCQDGDFVRAKSRFPVIVRDRTLLPPESRKFEYIAPEEIEIVIQWIVESSHGVSVDELARETCAKFGFSRITQQMQDYARQVIREMITKNTLLQKGDIILLVHP